MTTHEELDDFLKGSGIEFFVGREVAHQRSQAGVTNELPPKELWGCILPTLQILDELRRRLGRIQVLSGYRSPAYNRVVGGAERSLHKRFNAIDFRLLDRTLDAEDVAGELEDLLEDMGIWNGTGVGVYPKQGFVHLDTRGLVFGLPEARWSGAQ